jgi:uncharacterized protein
VQRFVFLLIALIAAAPMAAAATVDVYQSNTRVTGQRDETTLPGLERCFIDQMVKASGDPRLAENPEVIAMSKDSRFAIREYAYVDLYAGRPIMDEQGTRDRPYEMTVYYRPDKIAEALARAGKKPWGKNRPTVMVVLKVQHIARNYGVPIALVPGSLLEDAGLGYDTLSEQSLDALQTLAPKAGADVVMFGSLVWEPKVLGWVANWHMGHQGEIHHWNISGVNFDAAFRSALAGAAQILSGNGAPE